MSEQRPRGYHVRIYQSRLGYMDWVWHRDVSEVYDETPGEELPPLAMGQGGAAFTRWGARRGARRAIRSFTVADHVADDFEVPAS